MEVVPAPWTDSKTIDETVAIMKEIEQSPVVMKKEVNGFLLNRLQYAVIMEAWRLVEVKKNRSTLQTGNEIALIFHPRFLSICKDTNVVYCQSYYDCEFSRYPQEDRQSLLIIIINIRGQIENRPLQNTRSAGRKRLTAGC